VWQWAARAARPQNQTGFNRDPHPRQQGGRPNGIPRRERFPELLARYDALVQKRERPAQGQVLGIVNHMISEDTPNRAQVVQGTLDKLQKSTLVRRITGIRTLVPARIDNRHQDIDEDECLVLTYAGDSPSEAKPPTYISRSKSRRVENPDQLPGFSPVFAREGGIEDNLMRR
jgi:hypothetical protein